MSQDYQLSLSQRANALLILAPKVQLQRIRQAEEVFEQLLLFFLIIFSILVTGFKRREYQSFTFKQKAKGTFVMRQIIIILN